MCPPPFFSGVPDLAPAPCIPAVLTTAPPTSQQVGKSTSWQVGTRHHQGRGSPPPVALARTSPADFPINQQVGKPESWQTRPLIRLSPPHQPVPAAPPFLPTPPVNRTTGCARTSAITPPSPVARTLQPPRHYPPTFQLSNKSESRQADKLESWHPPHPAAEHHHHPVSAALAYTAYPAPTHHQRAGESRAPAHPANVHTSSHPAAPPPGTPCTDSTLHSLQTAITPTTPRPPLLSAHPAPRTTPPHRTRT